MKNNLKTMLALMAGTLALSACSEEIALENETPVKGGSTAPVLSFNAATESDGTRAAIDGLDIKWQEGDAILMLDGTHSSKYNLSAGAGSTIATFDVDAESTPVEGENIYALYPYTVSTLYAPTLDDAMDALGRNAWIADYFDYWKKDIANGEEDVIIEQLNGLVDSEENRAIVLAYLKGESLGDPAPELDGNNIYSVTLPIVQTVAPGQTVDPKAVLMMAKADADHNLEFKNIASYIKVTTTHACKKIEVRTKGYETLAGNFTFTYDNVPTAILERKSSPVVTLKAAEGFLAPGTYYIAVLPGTQDKGLEVRFYAGDDTFHYNNCTTSLTLARNKVNNGGDDSGETGVYWSQNCKNFRWCPSYGNLTAITINTNVDGTIPADAKALNNDATLWARVDGTKAFIETAGSKIMATDLTETFSYCENVVAYSGLDKIDVSEASSFARCFSNNPKVASLDLSSWQISPLAKTTDMFMNGWSLSSLKLNDTFHAGHDMFLNVGRDLADPAKCAVYGVTDEDLKKALSDSYTGFTSKNTKITFDWMPLGMCSYTDRYVCALFNVNARTYSVEIEENLNTKGLYRLVYPYDGKYPENLPGEWDETKTYYLEIHAENPDKVYILTQDQGIEWGSYGMMGMSSMAGYYIENGGAAYAEPYYGTLKDGVLSFPERSLLVRMSNRYYYGGGGTMLVMPDAANAPTRSLSSNMSTPKISSSEKRMIDLESRAFVE